MISLGYPVLDALERGAGGPPPPPGSRTETRPATAKQPTLSGSPPCARYEREGLGHATAEPALGPRHRPASLTEVKRELRPRLRVLVGLPPAAEKRRDMARPVSGSAHL